MPGPGTYSPKIIKKINPCYSSFISKTKHFELNQSEVPPPGTYNIQNNSLKTKILPKITNTTSSENFNEIFKIKELLKYIISKEDDKENNTNPGPGSYNFQSQWENINEKYINGSYFFRKENHDRFGEILNKMNSKSKNLEIEQITNKNTAKEKKIRNNLSAIFQSKVERKPYGNYNNKLGPSNNLPFIPPKKKSYYLNVKNYWRK